MTPMTLTPTNKAKTQKRAKMGVLVVWVEKGVICVPCCYFNNYLISIML